MSLTPGENEQRQQRLIKHIPLQWHLSRDRVEGCGLRISLNTAGDIGFKGPGAPPRLPNGTQSPVSWESLRKGLMQNRKTLCFYSRWLTNL